MDTDVAIKRRKPWLAGLFSLILPGLGHVYAGELVKGLLLTAALYFAIIIAGFVPDYILPFYLYGLILCLTVWYVYSLVSSIMLAQKNKEYALKNFNRWYIYIIIYLLATLASSTILANKKELIGFNTYSIPSQSMHPTLQVGDYITVDTRTEVIDVGDVVVFRYPKNPTIDYVFRVVAAAGDTVSIYKGVVTLNGKVEDYDLPIENEAEFARQKTLPATTIPDGEILVLGDYRARSNDSRFWGNVKVSEVIGKVRYVWYARDKSRIGTEIQ